ETSNYEVELPDALVARRIHPVFHVSLLRPHHANNDALFPQRDFVKHYDFGAPNNAEFLVDRIKSHRWEAGKVLFTVEWEMGDSTEEPLEIVNDLTALDDYLTLQGVTRWEDLPGNRPVRQRKSNRRVGKPRL
ncbi:hypothetical protein GGG16DRAFT_13029, partial [Schizophyllum commune]